MSGEIAAVSTASLAIVGVVSLAALLFGVIDILRLPGWAWQRAGKSRAVFLVLVIIIPVLGVVVYVFAVREAVAKVAGGGKAAGLPFEGVSGTRTAPQPGGRATGTVSPPVGFGSFGAASPPVGYNAFGAPSPPTGYDPFGAASPPVGGVRTQRTVAQQTGQPVYQQPITVNQVFRPSAPQRPVAATEPAPTPTVPSGWKADPTGRHQFRYWDGFIWTENVADSGVQSTDPVSS